MKLFVKFYFFFLILFVTKRQVVWLYGQTTELLLPFVVYALGQTTCRLVLYFSKSCRPPLNFSKILFSPPELLFRFQLNPSFPSLITNSPQNLYFSSISPKFT